jgi:hypothetical protein
MRPRITAAGFCHCVDVIALRPGLAAMTTPGHAACAKVETIAACLQAGLAGRQALRPRLRSARAPLGWCGCSRAAPRAARPDGLASTYRALRRAADALHAWELELDAARHALRERDRGELIDALLQDGDADGAWTAAAEDPVWDPGSARRARLAQARVVIDVTVVEVTEPPPLGPRGQLTVTVGDLELWPPHQVEH